MHKLRTYGKNSKQCKKQKNEVYQKLKKGDIIRVNHQKFYHYAVYLEEDSMVIHLTGDWLFLFGNSKKDYCKCPQSPVKVKSSSSRCKGCGKPYLYSVCKDTFDNVVDSYIVEIDNSLDAKHKPYPPDVIIKRAKALVGPVNYSLMKFNCEHFATFCRNGFAHSHQSGFSWSGVPAFLKNFTCLADVERDMMGDFVESNPNFRLEGTEFFRVRDKILARYRSQDSD